MVVNVYYSSNGNFFNTYDDIARIETGIKYHFLYTRYDNEEPVAVLRAGDFFLTTESVPDRQIITLKDIKSFILSETIPLEVFIYGIEGDDIFHVYSGRFKDVPLNLLSLPVNGIYPSSKNALDIYLDSKSIIKEGVEQHAKDNTSNN